MQPDKRLVLRPAEDLSAEARFLRLQDAADAAGALQPRIEQTILDEVGGAPPPLGTLRRLDGP